MSSDCLQGKAEAVDVWGKKSTGNPGTHVEQEEKSLTGHVSGGQQGTAKNVGSACAWRKEKTEGKNSKERRNLR